MGRNKALGLVIKVALPLVILVVLIVIKVAKTNEDRLNLTKYANVFVDGFDSRGEASVSIDSVGLETELSKYLSDEEYAEFAATVDASVDRMSNLSNGDKIKVTVSYDKKLAKEYGLDINVASKTYTVSGLENGKLINPFSDIKIITGGVSPYIYVTIDNESNNEYLKALEYTVDKAAGLSIGDTVTITCNADEDAAADKGYYFDDLQMEYTIEKADYYVSDTADFDAALLDEISAADIAVVEDRVRDTTVHTAYEVTDDVSYLYRDANEEPAGFALDSFLFAYNNTGSEYDHENCLIAIIHGSIALPNYSGTEDPYDYIDAWYGFIYTDAIITMDGDFAMATNEPERRWVCAASYDDLLSLVKEQIGHRYDFSEMK